MIEIKTEGKKKFKNPIQRSTGWQQAGACRILFHHCMHRHFLYSSSFLCLLSLSILLAGPFVSLHFLVSRSLHLASIPPWFSSSPFASVW